ncbi:MAG TPA: DnaJ domain-containing protein [bacterium]|nr:DnaJ domain-containing protein [bacterium]
MKAKIIICMKDEKYLRSLEKFIASKVSDCECLGVLEIKELSNVDISSYTLMIVSSLLSEGVWLKALPVIRKVQNFILLGVNEGPEITDAIALKYGAAAFFKLPLNSDSLLNAITDIIERAERKVKVPDIITNDFSDSINDLFKNMDNMNYYQFFGIERACSIQDMKKKYISIARKFHPDKFRNVPAETKSMVYEITKRANEAYSVLSHPNRKVIYDKMLTENPDIKRFDFRNKVAYKENPEDAVQNDQARRFAVLAKKAMDGGDFRSAITQLKMALSMEKNNSYLIKLMEEATQKVAPKPEKSE